MPARPPCSTPTCSPAAAPARRGRAGATSCTRRSPREISERLREVNRSFRAPAVIGPRAELWARHPRPRAGSRWPRCPTPRCWRSRPARTTSSCTRWRCTGRTIRSASWSRRGGRSARTGCSSARSSAARRSPSCAPRSPRPRSPTLGGLSPRVAPMGEIRDLGGLLQRAGFALPVADSRRFDVSYPDALALMRDLRAMGETNVMARPPAPADAHARCWRGPPRSTPSASGCRTDACAATFEVIFLTGWAPAPGQQRPLRPGSARARLADALGVPERGPRRLRHLTAGRRTASCPAGRAHGRHARHRRSRAPGGRGAARPRAGRSPAGAAGADRGGAGEPRHARTPPTTGRCAATSTSSSPTGG